MNNLKKLRVLCVEDDEFALSEMVAFLRKRVDKVYMARNGEEGIEQHELHKPDVIIADLLMPGMDGREMIRLMKDKKSKARFIIVTSVRELDTVLETVEIGVDNYIVKPVEPEDLVAKLTKAADNIFDKINSDSRRLEVIKDRRLNEDIIKKEFIKTVKSYMGKGPKEIMVSIVGREIKIIALDGFTVMEANLVENIKNHEVVRQGRLLAYEAICKDFTKFLEDLLVEKVQLDKVDINVKKRCDKIIFKYLDF